MSLQTDHLRRTIATLDRALAALPDAADDEIGHDLYRNAAIKSFELSLETAGKLLRKALRLYGGSPRTVDALTFNDTLRQAGKHALLEVAEVERWLRYRANRNTTAHDYGAGFANETLKLLPDFIADARALADRLQALFDAHATD